MLFVAHLHSGVLERGDAAGLGLADAADDGWRCSSGYRVQDRLDQERFRRLTLAVLVLTGLNLLRRALGS